MPAAYERAFDTEVAGVRIRAPMMRIHTVAAGGGSVLHYDAGRFQVGPDSAGANPGPAAYRRGGPLTVTDANVMTGKLDPVHFPAIFGPNQDEPLDADIVREKFRELADRVGDGRTPEEVAEGFITIAVENMANAIKKISVQRGYDVTGYALNCFGGAGGQHACLVADALGMKAVLIHPYSGLLSAYGIGLSKTYASRQHALVETLGEDSREAIDGLIADLEADAVDELTGQGLSADGIATQPVLHLRYDGTDTTIEIRYDGKDLDRAAKDFEAAHMAQFGFTDPSRKLIVEAVGVEASERIPEHFESGSDTGPDRRDRDADTTQRIFTGGEHQDAGLFLRTKSASSPLVPGDRVRGPAIIVEDNQTIVVEPGWQAEVSGHNQILMTRHVAKARVAPIGTEADPVMLEVFNNLFMSIAEQMGVTLQNTASSVNIKERLDFSCAVFDHTGALVANAPHMPVHLGSMDRSVESIIRQNPDMKPGDVYALNAPYNGGTHLPDITVVTPVFASPFEAAPDGAAPQDEGEKDPVLRRLARPPRRYRRHGAGIGDAARHPCRRGRRADRQFQAGRERTAARRGVHRTPDRPPVAGAQSATEPRRHARPDRRQREGRRRTAQDGRPFHPARRAGLYGACAGQRRGKRAPCHRRAVRLRGGVSDRQRPDDPGEDHRRQGADARRRSTSPAPRRWKRTISTRRNRWRARRCSMSSG